MKLKLTLRRVSGPASDIIVTTDAAATVADVANAIAAVDSLGSAAGNLTMHVAFAGSTTNQLLAPHTPISEAGIASGAAVSLVSAESRADAAVGPVLALLRIDRGPDHGRDFELRAGSSVIGRDEGCDIRLTDPLVSKRHARVEVTQTVDFVDLNSANGIVVDGDAASDILRVMAWWPEEQWRRMWDGDECGMCADAPLATNPFGDLILETDWSYVRLGINQTQAGYSVVIAKRHAPELHH